MTTFQIGKKYGNDLVITIVKRTAKTITIESREFGVDRVKVRTHANGTEWISYKAWLIDPKDIYNADQAQIEAIKNYQY